MRDEQQRLIGRWFEDNSYWVDDWIAAFPEVDRRFARAHLLWMLEPKAHRIAQGSKERLEVTKDELEQIKRRVASQQPERHHALDGALRPGPYSGVAGLKPAPEILGNAVVAAVGPTTILPEPEPDSLEAIL